jgi:hypothetical protein
LADHGAANTATGPVPAGTAIVTKSAAMTATALSRTLQAALLENRVYLVIHRLMIFNV